MVKDVKNIFIGLKKNLFECFRIEEIRDKGNETGLKEGGGNRNLKYTVLSIYAIAPLSFRLKYSPTLQLAIVWLLRKIPPTLAVCTIMEQTGEGWPA